MKPKLVRICRTVSIGIHQSLRVEWEASVDEEKESFEMVSMRISSDMEDWIAKFLENFGKGVKNDECCSSFKEKEG